MSESSPDTPAEAGEKNQEGLEDADFSALEGESLTGEESTPSPGATKRELDEYREKYLRALAELENYKKRALKDRSDLLKYQGERVLYDLLEVVDNFELALQHTKSDPEKLREGIEMIYKQFVEMLGKWSVKSESGMGKEFDPAKFSAISRVPVHDAAPGTIINELKKAYFYKDKLLRPGEVVVAEAAPAEAAGDQGKDENKEEQPSEEK